MSCIRQLTEECSHSPHLILVLVFQYDVQRVDNAYLKIKQQLKLNKYLFTKLNNKVPGIYPSSVNKMQIMSSCPQPFSARTPSGGSTTARIILQISVHVNAMFVGVIELLWVKLMH